MSSYSDPTERLSGDGAAGDGHAAPSLIGKRLGPWRVLELLGEGGMGLVYLGARDDQTYEQRVAIKVIRHVAAGTAEDFARFRRERQILARLEHPGIARLLDGGTTDDGSPYLVMEYVDGEPIDAYCEKRALPIEERLRLFRGVCAAVQYAHQKLVVHRDIKPANILVTAEGKAVLLDFGIAKLRDPEQTESVLPPTETVLTPAYASPEQVRHEPVGTATDVYSLGVVLYELLTGNLPYAARSTFEMMQAICGEEPLPPSRAAPPGCSGGSRAISTPSCSSRCARSRWSATARPARCRTTSTATSAAAPCMRGRPHSVIAPRASSGAIAWPWGQRAWRCWSSSDSRSP